MDEKIKEQLEKINNVGIMAEEYFENDELKVKDFLEIILKINELKIELLKLSGGF